MSRKVLIPLLYLYALAFSVLKTLRLPNQWAVAHWMLDYRFGFIKRGLAGETFGLFFTKNESSIGILSAVILGLLYLCIVLIAVKETYRQNCSMYSVAFCLIFFLITVHGFFSTPYRIFGPCGFSDGSSDPLSHREKTGFSTVASGFSKHPGS
ncbi:hypothetical protein [Chryseobacterium sp. SORGH_AS_1175]|uniref:hypothetical protein n=1 Tax=Chryseobacterium sp. SORGH_AS_1175 TaxID=3041760 RepID=UPI00286C255C|nr:hypothetical protein [Chryseobacterium sp. SORGH_AS_1175]